MPDNTMSNEHAPASQSLAQTVSLSEQPQQLPIRVWWGFMNPGLLVAPSEGTKTFLQRLGTDFMPQTIYIMSYVLNALVAYLPSVLLDVSKKLSGLIPDEVALVVYKSIDAYNAGANTPLGLLYQHIHFWLFAIPPSSSGKFPVRFDRNTFAFDTSYFLFNKENVDWQGGITRLMVMTPKAGQSAEDFRATIARECNRIQLLQHYTAADCVILRASNQCLTIWRHYPPGVQPNDSLVYDLVNALEVVAVKDSVKVQVPARQEYAMAKDWLPVSEGDSFNFQFSSEDSQAE